MQVALSDPSAAQSVFITPEVDPDGESLVFQLTITDNSGSNASATCVVNVSWQNTSPVANAGPDQDVEDGFVVTLDGSDSSDPDDGIAYYKWIQTSGPAVTLSDSDAVSPVFTAPHVSEGGASLTFRLTDNNGAASSDTCTVNVSWLNKVPLTDAGSDQTADEGEIVLLDGSNSVDPDDRIAAYQWIQTAGPKVSLSDTTTVQATFTAPDVGAGGELLAFQLTVTDNAGIQAWDTCIVNVSWIDLPPVADAGADQTAYEGVIATLDGSGSSDPDDEISDYLWSQTGGTTVTLSDPSAVQPTFTAPDVDTDGAMLVFQLTVTDSADLRSSDTCVVNVAWVNARPVANAGSDQAVNEGSTVTLDGSDSSDPDGSVSAYLWSQSEGDDVTLSDPTAVSPCFVPRPLNKNVAGETEVLKFRLTVTDEEGLQGSDEVLITVSDNGIIGFPDDVLTFRSSAGEEMGIKVNEGNLAKLIPIPASEIDDTVNKPDNLIYGLLDMRIHTTSDRAVTATIYLPDSASDEYRWYQHSGGNGWGEYENAVFNTDRDQVTLTLVDGGAGDDGGADGSILNTSGLGTGREESNGDEDEDDTVCFIGTAED